MKGNSPTLELPKAYRVHVNVKRLRENLSLIEGEWCGFLDQVPRLR